jgi:hypothetical protein
MKALPTVFALGGCLLAATAQAQRLVPDPASNQPPQLEEQQVQQPDPFAGAHRPSPHVYGGDVAAQPNDHVFKGFRRDPQLLGGVEVTPNVAIEGGTVLLPDRGLHKVEPGTENAPIDLKERGTSNHLGVKYALPESEGVSAYGKVGVAHSARQVAGKSVTDTGVYTGAGAKYKVDKATSVSGEYTRHGNAASKFGRLSKDGIKANLKMGF